MWNIKYEFWYLLIGIYYDCVLYEAININNYSNNY